MANYVCLVQWTEQGLRTVRDTTKRAEAAKALASKVGVNVTDVLWTVGPYDVVLLAEANDDESMSAYALSLAALGNVKTQTMRAFRAKEFSAILDKMGK